VIRAFRFRVNTVSTNRVRNGCANVENQGGRGGQAAVRRCRRLRAAAAAHPCPAGGASSRATNRAAYLISDPPSSLRNEDGAPGRRTMQPRLPHVGKMEDIRPRLVHVDNITMQGRLGSAANITMPPSPRNEDGESPASSQRWEDGDAGHLRSTTKMQPRLPHVRKMENPAEDPGNPASPPAMSENPACETADSGMEIKATLTPARPQARHRGRRTAPRT
jgi:hypothetical protein